MIPSAIFGSLLMIDKDLARRALDSK